MRFVFVGLCAVLFSCGIFAQTTPKNPLPEDKLITRGKYLVEGVAMCQDCHTPRNEKGEFDTTRWLGGSVLAFKPAVPIPGWSEAAPPLAGLEGWETEEAIKFLQTGTTPGGKPAAPPMPGYRLNQPDATAVVAYLKSLKK
jgi:mono/diheme cytochrome c family protein